MLLPLFVGAAAVCAAGFGGVRLDEMPIGFVSHYPFVEYQDDQVAATGATVIEVRAPWSAVQPSRDTWDFSALDRQLAWARASGLKLVYILECGPAHATDWVRQLVKYAGEETRDADGGQQSDPSIFSPVYRDLVTVYVNRCVGYIRDHDAQGTVVGYNNGCEWWYPLPAAYSPLDIAAFRDWLRHRYGSLKALNAAWEGNSRAWADVDAPRLAWQNLGGPGELGVLEPAGLGIDTAWITPGEFQVPVQPGKEYVLRAVADAEGMVGGGAKVEIAFMAPGVRAPVGGGHSASAYGDERGAHLEAIAKAPPAADRAWLLLKSCGGGKVTFRSVFFGEVGSDQDLAPNPDLDPARGVWTFVAFTAKDPSKVEHAWPAAGQMAVEYRPAEQKPFGVGNGTAAVFDWTTFTQEATADFIDWIAALAKGADPTRPVITYLTYSFAQAFMWDYTVQNNIALDVVCARARHQDVIGMQIAAADGDYHNVTCALDIARKYRKPMWAIDLQDFTSGVALGERAHLRMSLAVLQHGGTGISYYGWHGTKDYDYAAEMPRADLTDMVKTTKSVAAKLREMGPVAEVALVQPIMPIWSGLPEPANDFRDFMGWYKLLAASGFCADVYTLRELAAADLRGYRLLVVPDCAYIGEAALQSLAAAGKAGVAVITPRRRFAHRDMDGRERKAFRWPRGARVVAQDGWGSRFLGPIRRMAKAGNTPPVFVLQPGAPDFDGPVPGLLAEALSRLGVQPTVRPQPADPRVEACLLRGRGREAALLLNDGGTATAPVSVAGLGGQAEAVDLWSLREP